MAKSSIRFTDHSEEFLKAFDQALNRALHQIGEQAEVYAKEECPVDTGTLRDSIEHEIDTEKKTVTLYTNVPYAKYVELGTTKTKPQPFLKPAMTEQRDTFKKIIQDEIQNS